MEHTKRLVGSEVLTSENQSVYIHSVSKGTKYQISQVTLLNKTILIYLIGRLIHFIPNVS